MTIELPRLLDKKWKEVRRIRPISASVSMNIIPLSTATLRLQKGDSIPVRSYVEMFTSMGTAGLFRARSPKDAYGDLITEVELEHAVTEVGDSIIKGKVEGSMSFQSALTTIFSHYQGDLWKLGSIASGGTTVTVSFSYTSVLEALISVMEQVPSTMMTFDFSQHPWRLNIVNRGTTVKAEGRLSRNLESVEITYSDTDLCTRVYMEGLPGGSGDTYGYIDAETIPQYGIIEKQISGSSDYTEAEARRVAGEYLKKRRKPSVSVSISAIDLSRITGETLDQFEIGRLFRLTIPEDNLVLEETITGLEWGDVYGNPQYITVSLADEPETVVSYMHETNSTSGGASSKAEETDNLIKSYISKTDDDIKLYAQRLDAAENVLEESGIAIEYNGVLIYSLNNEKGIAAELKVASDHIGLVVDSKTGKIKPASIVAAINGSQSSVKISADHITLDGDAVAKSLSTKKLTVASLTSERGGISVRSVSTTSLKVGGVDCYLPSGVKAVQVTQNEAGTLCYLQVRTYANDSWTTVSTFSRAASGSISGSWSGGTYTATKDGASVSTTLDTVDVISTEATALPKSLLINYRVMAEGSGETPISTGKTGSILADATPVWENGYAVEKSQIDCTSTVRSIGTNRGSRASAGGISKSGLIVNSYLGFAISCHGTTQYFYIAVNP